jgi:hypothetical protein
MRDSAWGGTAFLRIALAAVVAADLLSFYSFLSDARADALAHGIALNRFCDLLTRTSVKVALVSIGIAAVVAFARRPGRVGEGMVALGVLALLSTAHAQLYGSPWRHLFFSGLCLAGWLLGLAVSGWQGNPRQESYARIGSIALLGASYLNAGISKLAFGGFDWISGFPIQAIVVGQDGLVPGGLLGTYRIWLASTAAAAGVFSLATLGFELAGPLMLVGRKTRACVALGLLGMHANIFALAHILYWQAMVLLAMFGLSPDPPVPAEADESAPGRISNRAFLVGVGLLALGAVVAIAHQARRYTDVHTGTTAVHQALLPTPPLRRLGPFSVGQRLAASWSIESLHADDEGLLIGVSGPPGRARFELTCASSQRRSPFDLGAAHIFYSSDVEPSQLQAVGSAVREQIRAAAAGGDVCELLASWRTAARTSGPPR